MNVLQSCFDKEMLQGEGIEILAIIRSMKNYRNLEWKYFPAGSVPHI